MDKNTFDKKMKGYELFDPRILKGIYAVARLDGRSFSKLTKELNLQKPFDDTFRDIMSNIVKEIMLKSGANFIYGYTESDEISLLLSKYEDFFDRRIIKIISILPSIASSVFTKITNKICAFDCRISMLPSLEEVIDYFQWRQNDSHRNALNGYCYWTLREKMTSGQATKYLENLPKAAKHDLLIKNGINYNDVIPWHKRGTAFYFKNITIDGYNPLKKEKVKTIRRRLHEDIMLTFGDEYTDFIKKILEESENYYACN